MSPTCKLTYFDAMGIGEPIRFLLHYGKIEFEDIRCDFEKWPSMKSSTPFGKLPLLEIDGKKMHQSIAICRYLGKKLGLAGENDWESAQIDMAVDTVTDLRMKVTECYWEPDEAIKKKKKETLLNETLPFYLERLDGMVKENGGYLAAGKSDFLSAEMCVPLNPRQGEVGQTFICVENTLKSTMEVKQDRKITQMSMLSWADFFFAGVSDYMDCVVQFDITKDHPNLAAIKKKICELPAIKDWISKRPKTSL